jgi:hypothetical protein
MKLPAAGRLFHYRDADGKNCAVWVEARMAKALDLLERSYRRREAAYRKRHRSLFALSKKDRLPDNPIDLDEARRRLAGARRENDNFGNLWEGPHKQDVSFTWYVGASRTWNGEPHRVVGRYRGKPVYYCDVCKGMPLPKYAYCLGCDACGREWEIGLPTEAEMKMMRHWNPKDRLKGGKGA